MVTVYWVWGLLVGGAWIAIGLLASSLTSNQIVAAVLGIGLLLLLYIVFSFLPLPSPYSDFFGYLNASTHAQSFHDGYVFCGSPSDQWVQLGNAVPPIMAEAIARSFRRTLERS